MTLIRDRRNGDIKELTHETAQQEAAAKRVLDLRQAMAFATPAEMPRLQDQHDTNMADLVANHGGDEAAAQATLAGVAWAQKTGKR